MSIHTHSSSSSLPVQVPLSDQTLQIRLPPRKVSKLSQLASIVVFSIAIYLLVQALLIYFEHRELFHWWKSNDGQRYSGFVSIFLLLNFYQGSSLLYLLASLVLPLSNKLSFSDVSFITGHLLSYARLPDPLVASKQLGILTPKQLCQTTLLHHSDGDLVFNTWLDKHPSRMQGASALDPDYFLEFEPPVSNNGKADYRGRAKTLSHHMSHYGVYPKPGDYNSWKGCFQAWANGGLDELNRLQTPKYVWYQDAKDPNLWVLGKNTDHAGFDDAKDPELWYDQPDNFLGRYGVKVDSPLVTFYVTGNAYIQGVPAGQVDVASLNNLMGVNFNGVDAGGWLGFMEGKGGDSADAFFNAIYSSVDTTRASDTTKQTCNQTRSALLGGLTGGLSSLAAAVPLLVMEIPFVFFAVAVAAGTIAGALDANRKCSSD